MDKMKYVLSPLGHTWFLDLDGTILKHNGYKIDGADSFLIGAKEFLLSLPPEDCIIFATSRKSEEKEATEAFLAQHGISYHQIVYDLPYGERLLLNDKKPSGLETAFALNGERDVFPSLEVEVNPLL